jgi:GNAT superfamily N-acetyltransferase
MEARPAHVDDSDEILRLARLMFHSMGFDMDDEQWIEEGHRQVVERLGDDIAIFVVDHPTGDGRLVAAAAGIITRRLPTPFNATGLTGYVQWVATDAEYRRRGLGRLAMTAMLAWYEARHVTVIELHATPVAEPLYLSLGFDDSGPRALRRRS